MNASSATGGRDAVPFNIKLRNNNSCEINSTGDAEIIHVKKKRVVNLKELMIPYPDKLNYAKCKLCFQNGDERILSKKSFSGHVKRFQLQQQRCVRGAEEERRETAPFKGKEGGRLLEK